MMVKTQEMPSMTRRRKDECRHFKTNFADYGRMFKPRGDPAAAAALAREAGITINVIGVMERDIIDEKGAAEIQNIAMSGAASARSYIRNNYRKLCKWSHGKR